jgi:UDP-N-acetylglucosamine 3-dehydrogenase
MIRLHLGLIGHGPWGRNIERTLRSFDDVSLTLITREMARPAGLDAVLVATPGPTHADVALPYIEKGIAAFIEKPMATSVADAERIRRAALASGSLVFVGHTDLYNPAFRRVLEILPTLGTIRHLLFEGMNNRPLAQSSVLWEWMPHQLAAARLILGTDPARAAVWDLSSDRRLGTAMARFDFASALAISMVSWQSPIKKRRLTITCEKGGLVFDDTKTEKLILYRDGHEPALLEHRNELPLTLEMRAFVDAVASGNNDPSQLEAAVAITRAIAGAERSASEGGTTVTLTSST